MAAALDSAKADLTAGSVTSEKAEGTSFSKKAGGAGKLFEGDFGVDAGNVPKIGAGIGEELRKQLLAGDDGAEAFIGRCELAAHNDVNAAGSAARVPVGILLPGPD